eukprot:3137111-Pyramimonas_sp.AAC.1
MSARKGVSQAAKSTWRLLHVHNTDLGTQTHARAACGTRICLLCHRMDTQTPHGQVNMGVVRLEGSHGCTSQYGK